MHRKSTPYLAAFFLLLCLLWSPLFKQPSMTVSSADTLLIFPPFNSQHAGYIPQNNLLSDQFTQFYPWMRFNRQEVRREKRFPLWNPHQEMGVPHWANTQNAAMAITTLPLYFLSLEKALSVRAFFIVFFAFWGMFLLFRLLLKESLMAFTGAMAFALGGYITVWLGHPHAGVAMWMGWLFWGFFRLVKKPGLTRMLYLSLFLFLSYLGGHVETAFHNVFLLGSFAVFYLVFNGRYSAKERGNIFLLFVASGIISFLLAAIFFFPFIEYLLRSWTYFARTQADSSHYVLSFAYLLNYFSPDIYGIPTQHFWLLPRLGGNYNEVNGGYFTFTLLIMAIPGIVVAGKKNLSVRVSAFFVLVLSLAFAYEIPYLHGFLNNLPLFSMGANTRLIYGVAFTGIILGITGWKEILENRATKLFAYVMIIFFFVAFLAGIFVVYRGYILPAYSEWTLKVFRLHAVRLLIIALGLVVLCRAGISVGLKKIFLALVVFLELAWFFQGYNPVIHEKLFYPGNETVRQLRNAGLNRAILLENILPANSATYYRFYDIRNYDALNHKRTIELSHSYRHILGGWGDYSTCGSPFFNFLGGQHLLSPQKDISRYDYYPAQPPTQKLTLDYNTILTQELFLIRDNLTSITFHVEAPLLHSGKPLLLGITPCLEKTNYIVFNRYESPIEGTLIVDIPSEISMEKGQRYYLQIKVDTEEEGMVEVSAMQQRGTSTALHGEEQLAFPLWHELRYNDGRYVFESEIEGIYWYRNTHVMPRSFMTNQVRVSGGDILDNLARSPMSRDYPEIFLEEERLRPEEKVRFEEMALNEPFLEDFEIKEYNAQRIVIPVETEREGILVLSDSWYPGWRVYVNGERRELLRVNYNFRGVALAPGEHLVEYRYRPWSFYLGVLVSFLFLIGTIMLLIYQKYVDKGKNFDIIN